MAATYVRPGPAPVPATAHLWSCGLTHRDIASHMDVSLGALRGWLYLRVPPPERLRVAVAELADTHSADTLMSMLLPPQQPTGAGQRRRRSGRPPQAWSPAARQLAAAEMTQQDLAAPLNANTSTVSNWFTGRSPAPPALAALLRHRLGAEGARPIIDAVPRWKPEP